MQRRQFLGALAATSLAGAFCAPNAQAASQDQNRIWKVGLAKAKITPEVPQWLAGYDHRTRPATTALHDLWIKAMALEDAAGRRALVITSDLLGIPQSLYDNVCREVEQRIGIDRGHLMLCVSHTHSGPVLHDALPDMYGIDDTQKKRIADYTLQLQRAIVEAAARAMDQRRPATLWAGEGTATFAVNRRNNREPEVPEIRQSGGKLKGPVDHAVPVMAVRSPQGRLLAVLCGYACHGTTLDLHTWSGDWPGFAQLDLEKRHPGAEAMFFQGCGADQNPLPRRSVELCQRYGRMLADAVDKVLDAPMRPVRAELKTAYERFALSYGEQPSRVELENWSENARPRKARWARRLLGELDAGRSFPAAYEGYPVEVWRLGDELLWITLGGEVVVDYSLKFKDKYGPQTWVAGYANDCMAYIPSRRVWQEGGYEAGAFPVYGLPAKTWTPRIEQTISDCVERLVQKVRPAAG